jgi:hypothetical protein
VQLRVHQLASLVKLKSCSFVLTARDLITSIGKLRGHCWFNRTAGGSEISQDAEELRMKLPNNRTKTGFQLQCHARCQHI